MKPGPGAASYSRTAEYRYRPSGSTASSCVLIPGPSVTLVTFSVSKSKPMIRMGSMLREAMYALLPTGMAAASEKLLTPGPRSVTCTPDLGIARASVAVRPATAGAPAPAAPHCII